MTEAALQQNIQDRFSHIYWSTELYNRSLTELHMITDLDYNDSELEIVDSHPFDFYRVTLQYCFIMEYCKLLEEGNTGKKEHICSLNQLNEVIYRLYGRPFEAKYQDTKTKLFDIKATEVYKDFKTLRDKKFAHADKNKINVPFNIKGLDSSKINQGFVQLETIREILLNCSSIYDIEYDIQIPHRDNRTENFIRYQAKYKESYFKNFR